mmetsp:Transcript_85676/g.207576  ORF Transcript_85676/g.207576 Transcript_85676/m.207576 type:complete len:236 (+) Transcript_85676:141-848(+)
MGSRLAVLRAGRRAEVGGPGARDDLLAAFHCLALGLRCEVAALLAPDLLSGLSGSLEDLFGPASCTGLQEVLDLELDALAVGGLAPGVGPRLEVQQAAADVLQRALARGHGLQGVADGVQQLAHALHDVLAGDDVPRAAHHEILNDRADDPGRQQLPEEEVADELHVGQGPGLTHLPSMLQLLKIHLLVLQGLGWRPQHGLKFVLAAVQQGALERHRFAAARSGELGQLALEPVD